MPIKTLYLKPITYLEKLKYFDNLSYLKRKKISNYLVDKFTRQQFFRKTQVKEIDSIYSHLPIYVNLYEGCPFIQGKAV